MSAASPAEDPLFFETPTGFRAWLEEHHDAVDVQWVGYYKKASGVPSITWPESVDEALCYGWIDGLRRSIDDRRYMIRFTPRRPGSHWSARNLSRMEELLAKGRVTESGRRIFEARDRRKEQLASYEQDAVELPASYLDRIRTDPDAWTYFQAAPPSYRKQVSWWIVSAKRETTRERRLGILIEASAAGEVIPPLRWGQKK